MKRRIKSALSLVTLFVSYPYDGGLFVSVRAETGISKGAVSISSAALEFSQMTVARDCGISTGLKVGWENKLVGFSGSDWVCMCV